VGELRGVGRRNKGSVARGKRKKSDSKWKDNQSKSKKDFVDDVWGGN